MPRHCLFKIPVSFKKYSRFFTELFSFLNIIIDETRFFDVFHVLGSSRGGGEGFPKR